MTEPSVAVRSGYWREQPAIRKGSWFGRSVGTHGPGSLLLRGIVPVLLLWISGCDSRRAGDEEALAQGLSVAEAMFAAGQPDVARDLFTSLADLHPDAPEPHLGLAQMALAQGEIGDAFQAYVAALDVAHTRPARMEALFGAGRAALSLEDPVGAEKYFLEARELAKEPGEQAWIANGLAISATLDEEPEEAAARFEEALSLAPRDPRILANYLRWLVATGQGNLAAEWFVREEASFWQGEDERELRHLIQEHWNREPEPAGG